MDKNIFSRNILIEYSYCFFLNGANEQLNISTSLLIRSSLLSTRKLKRGEKWESTVKPLQLPIFVYTTDAYGKVKLFTTYYQSSN